jgi:DNA-binding NtrC family response regulator
MEKVIVIAADRLVRAYLGAQLEEAGFEVWRSPGIIEASRTVREWRAKPGLVVIDSKDLDFRQDLVNILNRLCPDAPLLLVHGRWDNPETLGWTGGMYKLSRPLSVGQVVDQARDIFEHRQKIAGS